MSFNVLVVTSHDYNRRFLKNINTIVSSLAFVCLSHPAFAGCANKNVDIDIIHPDDQYIVDGNDTVIDKNTGLMWQRCNLGQSGVDCATGSADVVTWKEAIDVAQADTGFSYDDWRLPNVNELMSLVEIACYSSSINETIFPATASGSNWTSTRVENNATSAHKVGFSDGRILSAIKSSTAKVRLVRGGF